MHLTLIMTFSELTNYIINRFEQDELVNTIALTDGTVIDTKKESIYPLVTIEFNGKEIEEDVSNNIALSKYDYTITVFQQRDNRKVAKPSKLMNDENWIDNLNECDSICTNFINYINRFELDNISIDSLSILEPINNYGGANLDGFRFDITLSTPNTGYCHV